jgi:hypothetical protein
MKYIYDSFYIIQLRHNRFRVPFFSAKKRGAVTLVGLEKATRYVDKHGAENQADDFRGKYPDVKVVSVTISIDTL